MLKKQRVAMVPPILIVLPTWSFGLLWLVWRLAVGQFSAPRPLLGFSAQIFRPRSGLKICSTASSHYDAATTPILPVQRPILFHSVSLECMCNLGRCHSIYSPRYWGCQIGCIGIDRWQMRRFRQKKHISQKALFPMMHHMALLAKKYTIIIPPTHFLTQNFVLNPFLTSAGSES